MIRRPPRSTPLYSSAASDVYKRQDRGGQDQTFRLPAFLSRTGPGRALHPSGPLLPVLELSLIHISEPTRLRRISYAVFCLKKKKKQKTKKETIINKKNKINKNKNIKNTK